MNFPETPYGQTKACVFLLQNNGSQSVTISKVSLTGQGFQLAQVVQTPVVLPAGSSSSFTVDFVPSCGLYSGKLTVEGGTCTSTYTLSGTGDPTTLAPQIQFDGGAPASAQQRTVSMSLATPSPVSTSGTLLLSFKPGTSVVTDDPAVVFTANGTRCAVYDQGGRHTISIAEPGRGRLSDGWGNVSFSTSLSGCVTGTASASMAISATPPAVDHAIATSRSGDLDIQVWGYDNSYSAGAMSFTFYDLNRNVIQPGAVQADFTPQFRTYFATANAGSAFQMRVSFPDTGDSSQILAVDVRLTNSAGTTTIQHMNFQCAGGTCPVTSQ